jgi:hypothetical protein
VLGVLPEPPACPSLPPPPEPPDAAGILNLEPAPPPAEVIVVNPEPEIEEFEPLLPLLFPTTDAPPSPTVTVITVPPFTDCVEALYPPAPPPPPTLPPPQRLLQLLLKNLLNK